MRVVIQQWRCGDNPAGRVLECRCAGRTVHPAVSDWMRSGISADVVVVSIEEWLAAIRAALAERRPTEEEAAEVDGAQ